MACRIAALYLAALHVVVVCSLSFAATPLVIAELDVQRTIAEADLARATAEQEVAAWKFTQLNKLRRGGHASWQEVAQQEVTVKSATASAQASERYLQAVLQWQARLAKLDLRPTFAQSECVRLYMPRSARLVAWMSTHDASLELSKRHLENLRAEYQSLSNLDLSSRKTAVETAEHALEVDGRSERDADLMGRAEIQLRLAKAEYESAKRRQDGAQVIARRIALINESIRDKQTRGEEPSPAVARVGTRLVDATSDRELSRLVTAIATDETIAHRQIAWLEHQREGLLGRIDALQKLSQYSGADRRQLDQTHQQKTDLEIEIRLAQDSLKAQQQIAGEYEQMLKLLPTTNIKRAQPMAVDDAWLADANMVRHWLQLQQLKLQTVAGRAGIEAQRDYLVQRSKRVEQIPQRARRPKELDQMRHRIEGAEQQLAMADRELALLDRERQRFGRQLQAQRGDQYQLVQVGNGALIRREQFEVGAALIAAIGIVGHPGIFHPMPTTYPYIESTIILDCISSMSIQPPGRTAGILGVAPWRSGHAFLRPGARSSVWTAPTSPSGLPLATDGISYPADRFCYAPARWRPMHFCDRWAQRHDSRWVSSSGFRAFRPYDNYPLGACGQSIFSYRVGSPTRSSFPYRSSYLYRTAFPTSSILCSGAH